MQSNSSKTLIEKEVWKDVVGYKDYYRVSDLGKVKSLDRIIDSGRGYTMLRLGGMLKPSYRTGNYVIVPLRKKGIQKYRFIHHLVLEAFVGPCPKGMQCRHLNGKSWDNRLENLCWGTPKENCKDKWDHGTMAVAKLSESQATEVRRLYHEGIYSMTGLGEMFGLSPGAIHGILHRHSYAHVDDGYPDIGKQRKIDKIIADEIRRIYKDGKHTHKSLGELFGVSGSMISYIVNGKCWC